MIEAIRAFEIAVFHRVAHDLLAVESGVADALNLWVAEVAVPRDDVKALEGEAVRDILALAEAHERMKVIFAIRIRRRLVELVPDTPLDHAAMIACDCRRTRP